jgi:glycine betaine/proline transport system ATP-binding protein
MEKTGSSYIFVIDSGRRLQGVLTIDDALEMEKKNERDLLPNLIRDDVLVSEENTPIGDLVPSALSAKYPIAIQNEEGKFTGIVDRATVLSEVRKCLEEDNLPVPLSEVEAVA